MVRESPIGIEQFDEVIQQDCFYVDKTEFIKSWWSSKSKTTLITRPRRFGKTLTMSMLNCFFSVQYANRGDLFQNLNIWKYEEYRNLQGTYPVIYLSLANMVKISVKGVVSEIARSIWNICNSYRFILDSPLITESQKNYFESLTYEMDRDTVEGSLNQLCEIFYRVFGKKTIILLDEYDTPMISAYNKGYWEELTDFMRPFFNTTFKTNPYLEKALMTGITRVAKESMFSGLNNLKVVTTTSPEYSDVFGFTEQEVFTAMDARGKTKKDKQDVKRWYDGFTFGNTKEIYNPWSILNYLSSGKLYEYWADTSSNDMIKKLVRKGGAKFKSDLVTLLNRKSIIREIDECLNYNELEIRDEAVWSLLLSVGYLKVVSVPDENTYELMITNYEVWKIFRKSVDEWLKEGNVSYSEVVRAMLSGNIQEMNDLLNDYIKNAISYNDNYKKEPEIFYHGIGLGMTIELHKEYIVQSNRESGIGRADIIIYPRSREGFAYILEFKSAGKKAGDKKLAETVQKALQQIESKEYITGLNNIGFDNDHIYKLGLAFSEKKCLIGCN